MKINLPKKSDFPDGTEFYIKEFDVPLVRTPSNEWFNWFGGKPRQYDVKMLKPGNNWLAESFEEWVRVVGDSQEMKEIACLINTTKILVFSTWAWIISGFILAILVYSPGGIPLNYLFLYIAIGGILLLRILKLNNSIFCQKCKTKLIRHMEDALYKRKKLTHCPGCGFEIEYVVKSNSSNTT